MTVEEICADAGVSRRTFFNYFDSKDSAVLGATSTSISEKDRAYFLETPTDDLLDLTLRMVKSHMAEHYSSRIITERRQRIATDPDAALAAMGRHRAKAVEFADLLRQRLAAEPRLRRISDCSPATEALIIAGIAREALWLALASPDLDCAMAIGDRVDKAMEYMNSFKKGS